MVLAELPATAARPSLQFLVRRASTSLARCVHLLYRDQCKQHAVPASPAAPNRGSFDWCLREGALWFAGLWCLCLLQWVISAALCLWYPTVSPCLTTAPCLRVLGFKELTLAAVSGLCSGCPKPLGTQTSAAIPGSCFHRAPSAASVAGEDCDICFDAGLEVAIRACGHQFCVACLRGVRFFSII